ncbi:MAG: S-layer homology domain-containing protein, partial [Acidimicrobiia bacterium]
YSFSTSGWGSGDTEDPAFDPDTGDLYFLSGDTTGGGPYLFHINPANPGTLLDVHSISVGPTNFEGLTMTPDGYLLAGAENGSALYLLTLTGGHVQTISVSGIGQQRISGLGISQPGVGGADYDIWMADRRGTGSQYNEVQNDGRLWHLSTNGTPPPTTTTSSTVSTSTTTTTQPPTTTTTTQPTTTTTTQPPTTTTTTQPATTTTTTLPPPPDGQFIDTAGSVFSASIQWLADQGITQGCNPPANTKYCPNDYVTRGQMAAFIVRAKGYSHIAADYFIDDNNNVFEGAINKLRTAGVTQGCNPPTNNHYCPDQYVTRGQMAAFLVRAFNYTNPGVVDYFNDDNNSVFEAAINKLRTAGVTQGCNPPTNNHYCPNDNVTRGQMASFLKRAISG